MPPAPYMSMSKEDQAAVAAARVAVERDTAADTVTASKKQRPPPWNKGLKGVKTNKTLDERQAALMTQEHSPSKPIPYTLTVEVDDSQVDQALAKVRKIHGDVVKVFGPKTAAEKRAHKAALDELIFGKPKRKPAAEKAQNSDPWTRGYLEGLRCVRDLINNELRNNGAE